MARKTKNSGKSRATVAQTTPSQKNVRPQLNGLNSSDTNDATKRMGEVERYCLESKAKADTYSADKRSDADAYYESRKTEADEYFDEQKRRADEYYEGMKAESNALSDKINEEKRKSIEKERKEMLRDLESQQEECTRRLAEIESERENLRLDAERRVQQEIQDLVSSRDELEEKYREKERLYREEHNAAEVARGDLEAFIKTFGPLREAECSVSSRDYKIEQLNLDLKYAEESNSELQDEIAKLKDSLRRYGEDPDRLYMENEELKTKVCKLKNELADYPSELEMENLREISKRYEKECENRKIIERERDELEREKREWESEFERVDMYRRFIKILEQQKAELETEVNRTIKLQNNKSVKVFPTLSKIDKEPVPPTHRSNVVDLKKFCEDFRSYLNCRDDRPLYYDAVTIRTFVAGFASSRLMIMEGLSGTGKSSLPVAFQDFTGGVTTLVPVQSSWKDRNDLIGFYNDFKKQYKETEFLNALYRAIRDPSNIHCIVLDEMNISRIEYYFADFLSILQNSSDKIDLSLISDPEGVSTNSESWPEYVVDGKLRITDNIWFIGTANNDDSTSTITDKVYDRAVVIEFEDMGLPDMSLKSTHPTKINKEDFLNALNSAKWTGDDRKRFLGLFDKLTTKVKELFRINFGNRVVQQLYEFTPAYIACGGTYVEAIDIMFSRKILRKIDGLYDESTAKGLKQLDEYIRTDLKNYDMSITRRTIKRMLSEQ